LADVGALLTAQGVPVIFDATANRPTYRDRARQHIPHFLEILMDCPLAACMARDPKGIYRQGQGSAAKRVVALLPEKGYIR
jgi:adenylylsulfate kinase-like enzyme